MKKEKWDGRSRPATDKYKEEWNRIFNPVAKEVRTPKYKSQIIKPKKGRGSFKKGAWSAAINAEVARGKAAGLYIEQKIIRTGKLEDLTTEELEARMKTIIDDYSPILEDVSFEEIKDQVKSKSKTKEESESSSES